MPSISFQLWTCAIAQTLSSSLWKRYPYFPSSGVTLLLVLPFTTSPLSTLWDFPKPRASPMGRGTKQAQVPLKEGLFDRVSEQAPMLQTSKLWAQFFTVRRQHLFMCLMFWPWSALPEESSSGISNLTRHFIFPAASNSINRKLIKITLSPQEVRPHKNNFQIYGLTHKPFLTHFNDLHLKHSRHFSTKCLRSTHSPASHPKGRRNW